MVRWRRRVVHMKTMLTATLSVRDWNAAVEFYASAFNAVERFRVPGGGVGEYSIDGAVSWLAEESVEHANFSPQTLGGCSVRMLLLVDDPAAVCKRAILAGGDERGTRCRRPRLAHRANRRPVRPPLGDRASAGCCPLTVAVAATPPPC